LDHHCCTFCSGRAPVPFTWCLHMRFTTAIRTVERLTTLHFWLRHISTHLRYLHHRGLTGLPLFCLVVRCVVIRLLHHGRSGCQLLPFLRGCCSAFLSQTFYTHSGRWCTPHYAYTPRHRCFACGFCVTTTAGLLHRCGLCHCTHSCWDIACTTRTLRVHRVHLRTACLFSTFVPPVERSPRRAALLPLHTRFVLPPRPVLDNAFTAAVLLHHHRSPDFYLLLPPAFVQRWWSSPCHALFLPFHTVVVTTVGAAVCTVCGRGWFHRLPYFLHRFTTGATPPPPLHSGFSACVDPSIFVPAAISRFRTDSATCVRLRTIPVCIPRRVLRTAGTPCFLHFRCHLDDELVDAYHAWPAFRAPPYSPPVVARVRLRRYYPSCTAAFRQPLSGFLHFPPFRWTHAAMLRVPRRCCTIPPLRACLVWCLHPTTTHRHLPARTCTRPAACRPAWFLFHRFSPGPGRGLFVQTPAHCISLHCTVYATVRSGRGAGHFSYWFLFAY